VYLNLKYEMDRTGVTIDQIATTLGIHRNSASNKMNGSTPFTVEEAIYLRDMFFPYADFQYLYRKMKVEKAG
jgi:plasmid maintenance system antidote protein VapI